MQLSGHTCSVFTSSIPLTWSFFFSISTSFDRAVSSSSSDSANSCSPVHGPSSNTSNKSSSKTIPAPSEIQLNQLFDCLAKCKSKPSILFDHYSFHCHQIPNYHPQSTILTTYYMELLQQFLSRVLLLKAILEISPSLGYWFNMKAGG